MTQEGVEQLVEKSWSHLAWPILLVLVVAIGAQFLDNTFVLLLVSGIALLGFVAVRANKDDQLTGILLLSGGFAGFAMGLASSITKMAIHKQIWLIFGVVSEPVVLATVGVALGLGIAFLLSRVQPILERR